MATITGGMALGGLSLYNDEIAKYNGYVPKEEVSSNRVTEQCAIIIKHGCAATHTFNIPCYPESINDAQSANWVDQTIVGRYAPISSYAGLNYRSVNYSFILHRDMMPDTNTIEDILKGIRSSQYPRYKTGIIPPTVIIRCGEFRINGIVRSYSYAWEKPIVKQKYQVCTISLTIDELPEGIVDARSIISSLANISGSIR